MDEIDSKKKDRILLIKLFKKYFIIPFLILFLPLFIEFLVKLQRHEKVEEFLFGALTAIYFISLVIALLILKLWFYKRDNK